MSIFIVKDLIIVTIIMAPNPSAATLNADFNMFPHLS